LPDIFYAFLKMAGFSKIQPFFASGEDFQAPYRNRLPQLPAYDSA
jgi:hypothetical protein